MYLPLHFCRGLISHWTASHPGSLHSKSLWTSTDLDRLLLVLRIDSLSAHVTNRIFLLLLERHRAFVARWGPDKLLQTITLSCLLVTELLAVLCLLHQVEFPLHLLLLLLHLKPLFVDSQLVLLLSELLVFL